MSITTPADDQTRTIGSTTVPTAGTYTIDPSHSSVEFTVRHLGLAKVRGRFIDFSGAIVVAEDPSVSQVDVDIDAASFDTGNPDRDAHVKGADFLDVEQYPSLTFATTGVRQGKGDQWLVDGDLTIRGVSRAVTLAAEFEGVATDPWGNGRIGFTATTEINRDDFGVNWNQALEAGGVLVSKQVKISIEVSAVRS